MPTNACQLSEDSLELLRRQAHRLRYEMNLTWGNIAAIMGVSLSTLMVWVRGFHLNSAELGEIACSTAVLRER